MGRVRLVCNGVMALTVGCLAGWLYTHPAGMSVATAKLMNIVSPIVTPRAKEPAAVVASKPSSEAPAPVAAPPAPKPPIAAAVIHPVKKAAAPAKPATPAVAPARDPQNASAPKKRKRVESDD